jgi:hypothetical protein
MAKPECAVRWHRMFFYTGRHGGASLPWPKAKGIGASGNLFPTIFASPTSARSSFCARAWACPKASSASSWPFTPSAFQLVRHYGWYSNKMPGRRAKHPDEEVQTAG